MSSLLWIRYGILHSPGPVTMSVPHLRKLPQGVISPCSQYTSGTLFLGAKSY
jgi:hypothetical protein